MSQQAAKKKKHKASTIHFWRGASVLLNYKPQLVLGAVGAIISGIFFGAGLSMLFPVFKMMVGEAQTLQSIIQTQMKGVPDWVPFVHGWASPENLGFLPTTAYGGYTVVVIVVMCMMVIGALGNFLHEYMAVTVTYRGAMRWRKKLVDKLVATSYESLLKRGGSEDASRVLVDSNAMASGFERLLGRELGEIIRGIFSIIFAFILDWQLSLTAIGMGVVAGLFLAYVGKVIRKAARGALQYQAKMLSLLNAWMHTPFVVKVHGAEGVERRRFSRINRGMYKEQVRARLAKAISSPTTRLLSFVAAAIAGQWAAYLILEEQTYQFEELMTVMILLVVGGASLKPIEKMNSAIQHSAAAAERVFEIIDLHEEKDDLKDLPNLPSLERHHQSLVFENIDYSYPSRHEIDPNTQEDQLALKNVTLNIDYGQNVAIVGGNGSGKTTLLSMLPRLLTPKSGRVLVDDVDVSTVRLKSLRNQLSVVSQHSVLFEGTIAENICYGQLSATDDAIIEAAQAARAHDFIEELPEGYNTKLGEGGSGLSGGQRQRLCIARAVLRDPAILILDEATSQIDSKSESEINEAIKQLSQNRTTIVIAHRLSTVVDADLIVVMKDGQIVAQGKHEALLESSQEYQILTQTQLVKK